MAKVKNIFVCQECGFETPKWIGKCPDCSAWNTMVEEVKSITTPHKIIALGNGNEPKSIINIKSGEFQRYNTGIVELNRVLGGGIVKGSLTLISGAPGIGKSTLLLQAASNIASKYGKVLYISGEESEEQIKIRADRLGVISADVFILSETNLELIEEHAKNMECVFVIIDSIQSPFYTPHLLFYHKRQLASLLLLTLLLQPLTFYSI